MLPRFKADYRTLVWALTMPVVLVSQIVNPKLMPYLSPVSFYLAMAAGTMAHNHNHCPVFKSKAMNTAYAAYVSVFYGYPSFAWIPTHNLNHHKHVNREGDATITWRHTNRNTWWIAFSYFFVSAYFQSTPIKQYIAKAKTGNPKLHRTIVTQYVVWVGALVATLAVSVGLHGWTGFKVWVFAMGLPTLFGSYTMMWFNYMQHVHCDPWSKYNHSRNITGRTFNFLLFNNGLHTVHHANAGAHWSTAYGEHAKIADKIDPWLNYWSFWHWVVRAYVITAVFPRFETKQLGRAPFDRGDLKTRAAVVRVGAETDDVDALEAGQNAQIA